MNKSIVFGILGAAALAAGVFTPVVSYPTGNQTFLQIGQTESYALFGLAALSLILAIARKTKLIWIGGVGAMGVLVYTFFKLQRGMSAALQTAANAVADSIATSGGTTTASASFQWGWGVLLLGAVLLISAAATGDEYD